MPQRSDSTSALGRTRRVILAVAAANLLVGLAAEGLGIGFLGSLGFGGYSAFAWGVAYGFLALVAAGAESSVMPLRVFATTLLQLAQAGTTSTSRLENLRRLAVSVKDHVPGVAMDPETRAFAEAGAAPARLPRMAEFAAYDARYGSPSTT